MGEVAENRTLEDGLAWMVSVRPLDVRRGLDGPATGSSGRKVGSSYSSATSADLEGVVGE